jgi:cyclopropane fatty-acyl-phospholipid synthase-like methyltransferase
MREMFDQKGAWDNWYRSNPTVWKGSPFPLPDLSEGARVLDVGCGTGNTMIQALEMGYETVGIDISDHAVERSRDRISARGFDAELITGDTLDETLDIGKFDCVLVHHVLDNMVLVDREKMVSRVKDLLVEGGIVSFQDLSINDVRFGKGTRVEENTFEKGDGIRIHFFDLEETRELFMDYKEIKLEEMEWDQGKGSRKLRKSRLIGIFQVPSFSTLGSTSGA